MKKAALLSLLGVQLLVIVGVWLAYHVNHPLGNRLTGEAAGQMLAWGRLAGLLAAFAILLQVLLIGRVCWVERLFGFDRLTHLHHRVGFALLALLVAHPILLTLGHAAQAGTGAAAQWLDFVRQWEDLPAAIIGLGIVAAASAVSVAVLVRRLRYEIWYATHLSLYLALVLAFGHQLAVGSDFTENRWFAWYWIALHVFVFGNLLAYRLVRPLRAFARHRFAVARVEPEVDGVTSVYITGRRLEAFPAEAGQFLLVRFLAPGLRWESHPFSLSCRPGGECLRLTIKAVGDFTRRMPDLRPGTRVLVDGPHGLFTARQCTNPRVLLIAGGIGITPLRALAEEFVQAGRDVVLVYGNRRRDSVVFERELEALVRAAGGRMRVVVVLSQDPTWAGERGSIDRERLERLVPDVRERDVFLCGPPVMMRSVRAAVAALGLPRARLHDERFAL